MAAASMTSRPYYDEVNRIFMTGVEWTLGHSLDALDDLL